MKKNELKLLIKEEKLNEKRLDDFFKWAFSDDRGTFLNRNLDILQKTVAEWGDKTFPEKTNESVLKHLKKEVAELSKDRTGEECADVFMILLHFCHMNGFSLYDETCKKYNINLKRKWKKPDKDGVVYHIKD